ncbi:hypothetical protein CTI12_AA318060 [Artemisia annua]|uniref:Uncharacterized protein n=1 Tax=Artemisia annua TaxID=35608 RepID=A0A2U1MXT4_ARTAN|nr:hypothetical protein CTI12_AA318060 [Artemisia annua]
MPKPNPIYKHKSWSPDIIRDEEWVKRKNKQLYNNNRIRDGNNMKSVTDDDIDELKACIELGFGFDDEVNDHLSDTLPALPFYYAVNKRFQDSSSLTGSPVHPLLDAGDDPEMMKTRLRQWAQVVACSLRQSSSSSSLSSQGS